MHIEPRLAFRSNRTPGVPGFAQAGPAQDRPRASREGSTSLAAGLAGPSSGSSQTGDRHTIEADAERLLRQAPGGSTQPVGSSGWLQRAGLNIRRASDAQHLEAIALAYATYIRISASPLRTAIIAELETLSGRKRSRTTHDLHLIGERFVSYGGETASERLAARKLISRDVRAIQHLEAARVLPSQVQALAATPGQGLHAWARQTAAARHTERQPTKADDAAKQAKAEARQRALVHKVTITTRRPDGTRKARHRYAITGVLLNDVASLRRRLGSLARRPGPAS